MGLDAATEALRWGVNDLGGTLMEESICRMAGSLPRREARPGRPDRARRSAPGRPAAQRDTLLRHVRVTWGFPRPGRRAAG